MVVAQRASNTLAISIIATKEIAEEITKSCIDPKTCTGSACGLARTLLEAITGSKQDGRQENQRSISQWALETFGPAGLNSRSVARANREMAELLEHVTSNDNHPELGVEIADIMICLFRLADRIGVDALAEVDRKMAINRAREWNRDGTGHGYHVKPGLGKVVDGLG